jgi:hypothetical protein
MGILNLTPIVGALVPSAGDDSDVTIKRWVLKLVLPAMLALCGLGYHAFDGRLTTLETAPTSTAAVQSLNMRVENIEKMIVVYEQLRMQRERQIAELQTEVANMKATIDQMRGEVNGKLDRLLLPRRSGNND